MFLISLVVAEWWQCLLQILGLDTVSVLRFLSWSTHCKIVIQYFYYEDLKQLSAFTLRLKATICIADLMCLSYIAQDAALVLLCKLL